MAGIILTHARQKTAQSAPISPVNPRMNARMNKSNARTKQLPCVNAIMHEDMCFSVRMKVPNCTKLYNRLFFTNCTQFRQSTRA